MRTWPLLAVIASGVSAIAYDKVVSIPGEVDSETLLTCHAPLIITGYGINI